MKYIRTKHVPASALVSGLAASSFPSQPIQAERPVRQNIGFFRLLQTCSLIGATLLAGASPSMAQAPQSTQDAPSAQVANPSDSDAYATAVDYVVHFYPLWFTYQQFQVNNHLGATNSMVAPSRVSPDFKFVVASNYDTLYSSAFLDLTTEPVVVTVPPRKWATPFWFWTITATRFRSQFLRKRRAPMLSPVLDFQERFRGMTQIPMPINFPLVNFRAVKFSTQGEDQNSEAAAFIAALKTQPLSGFRNNPSDGDTIIAPERYFTKSFKMTADGLIETKPLTFLQQLQTAVKSPQTPTLSPAEQQLSNDFDELFGNGDNCRRGLSAGAQKALAIDHRQLSDESRSDPLDPLYQYRRLGG